MSTNKETKDPAKEVPQEKEAPVRDPLEVLAEHYKGAYPKNKTLFVASDGMVFLENEQGAAEAHQKAQKQGELKTVKIK